MLPNIHGPKSFWESPVEKIESIARDTDSPITIYPLHSDVSNRSWHHDSKYQLQRGKPDNYAASHLLRFGSCFHPHANRATSNNPLSSIYSRYFFLPFVHIFGSLHFLGPSVYKGISNRSTGTKKKR